MQDNKGLYNGETADDIQKLILEDIESFMKELGNYKLEIIKNKVNILMYFA